MRTNAILAIAIIACVAVIGASAIAESSALLCIACNFVLTVWDLSTTVDNGAQTITLSWDSDSRVHDTVIWGGFDIEYWVDGSSTKSTAHTTSESWSHPSPAVETPYKYKVRVDLIGNTGVWSSEVSAKILVTPNVTSASFAESTNTITLNTNVAISQVKASYICVHNTLKFTTDAGVVYEPFSRCGSSASTSGSTVTVVVGGEYSVNATASSESIGIAKESIKGPSLWNSKQQEIILK